MKLTKAASLTKEDVKLLLSMRANGEPTASWLLPLASRKNDAARTKAKRLGWATFDREFWGWRITPAGRAALSAALSQEGE